MKPLKGKRWKLAYVRREISLSAGRPFTGVGVLKPPLECACPGTWVHFSEGTGQHRFRVREKRIGKVTWGLLSGDHRCYRLDSTYRARDRGVMECAVSAACALVGGARIVGLDCVQCSSRFCPHGRVVLRPTLFGC